MRMKNTVHVPRPRLLCGRAGAVLVRALVVAFLASEPVFGHDVYMMNSNHTDYNWNATAAAYDAAMLQELDYYLAQIAATAGAPPEEQARYVPDHWYWLWLYEANRTPAEFQVLIDAIRSGHITVPLNPFVTLYGAMATETTIRAGYYPGRIQRQFDIDFRLADDGTTYFLEANPNPEIAESQEFAAAARHDGITYPDLLQRILALGMRRAA